MSDSRHQTTDAKDVPRKRTEVESMNTQDGGGYRKLQIYERSYAAALAVYRMTQEFPKSELGGITDQIRRASVSIPLNIAEGHARKESQKEFKRFLMMAVGSTDEVRVLLDFAKDLGYVDEGRYIKASTEYEEIKKMLAVFISKVKANV